MQYQQVCILIDYSDYIHFNITEDSCRRSSRSYLLTGDDTLSASLLMDDLPEHMFHGVLPGCVQIEILSAEELIVDSIQLL